MLLAGMTAELGIIILWLLWRREAIDTDAIVLTSCWALSLVSTRGTVLLIAENVVLWEASVSTKLFAVAEVVIFLGLSLLPLLAVSRRIRSLLRGVALRIGRFGPGPLAAVLVASLILIGLLQWSDHENLRIVLLTRACVQVLLVLTGPFLALLLHSPSPPELPAPAMQAQVSRAGRLALFVASAAIVGAIGTRQLDYLNPDGLAYFSIARSYAETGPAVRGYWSPLISWMGAAGMVLGMDPRVAFKAACGIAALAWIGAVDLLAAQYPLRPAGRLSVVTLAAYTGITFAYSKGFLGAADVLGAAALAVYFALLLRASSSPRRALTGMLLGAFGALAYFAKYFNFPFVLAHLVLVGTVQWIRRGRDRSIPWALIAAFVTFGLITGPWIVSLSRRYGSLTVSTAGSINHTLGGDPNHPTFFGRLCPVGVDVPFPFQDPPPKCYPGYGWSPLDSLPSLARQIRMGTAAFLGWARNSIVYWGPWVPLAMAASVIVAITQRHNHQRAVNGLLASGSMTLNLVGYLLMGFSEPRFYVGTIPLLWIALLILAEALTTRLRAFAGGKVRVAVAVLGAGVYLLPLATSGRLSSLQYLLEDRPNPCLQMDSMTLAPLLDAPFAGADPNVSYIAYYSGRQTFGALSASTPSSQVDEDLREQGIRSFLVPLDEPLVGDLLGSFGFTLGATVQVCSTDYALLRR
jgi:hypothetical protein